MIHLIVCGVSGFTVDVVYRLALGVSSWICMLSNHSWVQIYDMPYVDGTESLVSPTIRVYVLAVSHIFTTHFVAIALGILLNKKLSVCINTPKNKAISLPK